MFASSQRAAKGKRYRNAKHCCYSGYFPWALCRAGWISQCIVCASFIKWNTCIYHSFYALYELIFCSCSNKQVYSQVKAQKKQMRRVTTQLGAPSKNNVLLSWPRSSTQGRVILRITRRFLLSSRCPAHGLCLAAAQRHHGKERFSPCWLLLPHLLKEKKPARLLPCPQISRAATGAGISPKWHRRSLFTSTPFCNHTCQGMLILLSVLHSILGGKAFQSSKIPGEDLPLSNQRIEADPLTHASNQY